MISFELKGGREPAVRFMDSLKLASIVTHVADAKTCVLHPASHTHRQLNDQQLKEAGISTGMIRLLWESKMFRILSRICPRL